jgi:hypothetical protein
MQTIIEEKAVLEESALNNQGSSDLVKSKAGSKAVEKFKA